MARLRGEGAEGVGSLEALVSALRPPRVIWLMVPTGAPVDTTLHALCDLCAPGDIFVDGGNSFYKDSVRRAGEVAKQLLEVMQRQYGARAYQGGPGVSIAGDDVLSIAMEQAGVRTQPSIAAIEAAGLVAMEMLGQDGILTIGAVSMPGSAPVLRLMMYPDGARLGVERIAASVENAIGTLGEVVNDVDAVREKLLG